MMESKFTNNDGKVVGQILFTYINANIGYDKAYVSQRTPIHFHRKFSGFGLDLNILKELTVQKVDWIVIDYLGKKGRVMYLSNLDEWFIHGEPVEYEKKDDSGGTYSKQIILSTKYMRGREVG